MTRSRYSAAFYLILVFASGVLVGIAAHRLYTANTVIANISRNPPPPRNLNEFRKRYLDGMREKVGANSAQLEQISRILTDTKRKFDELHAKEKPLRDKIQQEQIDQIKAVLDDSQKAAYDNWRAERSRLAKESKKN